MITKENFEELLEMRRKLDQARNMRMGVDTAERRFMNCLYRNYPELVATVRKVEELEKELAQVKEERDLFEDTLARQDEELRKTTKTKGRAKQE